MKLYRLPTIVAAVSLLSAPFCMAQPSAASSPQAAASAAGLPNIELQAWEIRRAAYTKTVNAVRSGDAVARKAFEHAVREFEARPFEHTPLEAMDLLGSVFVPQAGLEKMLPVIVAHAALGLYDANRFATPVGQAELLLGENFLKRALTLAGPAQAEASKKFFRERPALAAALVQQGLRLAEAERNAPGYDTKWVTALGREGAFCPPGAECPKYVPPARDEWDRLWQQARERVTAYYVVEPAPVAAKK